MSNHRPSECETRSLDGPQADALREQCRGLRDPPTRVVQVGDDTLPTTLYCAQDLRRPEVDAPSRLRRSLRAAAAATALAAVSTVWCQAGGAPGAPGATKLARPAAGASAQPTIAPPVATRPGTAPAAPVPADADQAGEATRLAVAALLAGDYAAALARYRKLALGGDDAVVHAEIVRILSQRLAERCGSDCQALGP